MKLLFKYVSLEKSGIGLSSVLMNYTMLLYSKLIACSCRFVSSDEPWEVPEWFLDDERKHRKKPVPVTKEMVEEYKQKWKEIDARPIKRVAEAKARKKRRVRQEDNGATISKKTDIKLDQNYLV